MASPGGQIKWRAFNGSKASPPLAVVPLFPIVLAFLTNSFFLPFSSPSTLHHGYGHNLIDSPLSYDLRRTAAKNQQP